MNTGHKTKDRAMDGLLRVHLGNRAESRFTCGGLDADLANAYVEHRLSASEVDGYQRHLSECARCRTSVVALARMSEAEAGASSSRAGAGRRRVKEARLSSGWWLTLTRPQWAAVAVATIALAVCVPLLLSQKDRQSSLPEMADASRGEGAALQPATKEPYSYYSQTPAASDSGRFSAGSTRANGGRKSELETKPSRVPGGEAAASASADQSQLAGENRQGRTDARSAEQVERQARGEPPVASAETPGPRAKADEKKQTALIDKEKARRLPSDDKDTTTVAVLKPGDSGVGSKTPEGATLKSEAIAPPPAAPRSEAAAVRKEVAQPAATLMLREGSGSEAARGRSSAEPMKIGKKTFFLIKDTWTDKAYDPTKELPVVTLVRNSDVYNEEIAKRKDLKMYVTKFTDDQRALIVLNKTVYKVIPQEQK